MKVNRHKLLHYVLIILMMFAPLRSVMAMQHSHCNMASHTEMTSHMMSDQTSHHDMMAMSMVTGASKQSSHDCCTGSGMCKNICHMSMPVSILMQDSSYISNFTSVSRAVALSTDLIKRELTPPFRPPLVFHS